MSEKKTLSHSILKRSVIRKGPQATPFAKCLTISDVGVKELRGSYLAEGREDLEGSIAVISLCMHS